jgi:hypothetical protein
MDGDVTDETLSPDEEAAIVAEAWIYT